MKACYDFAIEFHSSFFREAQLYYSLHTFLSQKEKLIS